MYSPLPMFFNIFYLGPKGYKQGCIQSGCFLQTFDVSSVMDLTIMNIRRQRQKMAFADGVNFV